MRPVISLKLCRAWTMACVAALGVRAGAQDAVPAEPRQAPSAAHEQETDLAKAKVNAAVKRLLEYKTEMQGATELIKLPADAVIPALRAAVFGSSEVPDRTRALAYGVVSRVSEGNPSLAEDLLFAGMKEEAGVRAVLPRMAEIAGPRTLEARAAVDEVLQQYAERAALHAYADYDENETLANAIDVSSKMGSISDELRSLSLFFASDASVTSVVRRSSMRLLIRNVKSEPELIGVLYSVQDAEGQDILLRRLGELGDAAKIVIDGVVITQAGRESVEQFVFDVIRRGEAKTVGLAMVAAQNILGPRLREVNPDGSFEVNKELVQAVSEGSSLIQDRALREDLARSLDSLAKARP